MSTVKVRCAKEGELTNLLKWMRVRSDREFVHRGWGFRVMAIVSDNGQDVYFYVEVPRRWLKVDSVERMLTHILSGVIR